MAFRTGKDGGFAELENTGIDRIMLKRNGYFGVEFLIDWYAGIRCGFLLYQFDQ